MTQILGLASGVFAFLDTNMLVSFALGDAKVWRWGSKPTPVPNANGFASQWNIGLRVAEAEPALGKQLVRLSYHTALI